MADHTEDEISFTVMDTNGQERDLRFTPGRNEGGSFVLGFSLAVNTKEGENERFSLIGGIRKGWNVAEETISSLRNLVSRRDADLRSEVTGMARSALMIGDITSLGFESSTASGMRQGPPAPKPGSTRPKVAMPKRNTEKPGRER